MINNRNEKEVNDTFFTKGICSIDPSLASIQEVLLSYIKELSFYLYRLKGFGITNENIKADILKTLFTIFSNHFYNQTQFQKIISKLYNHINQSKFLYEKYCEDNEIEQEKRKIKFKNLNTYNLQNAVRKGEKNFIKRSLDFTNEQKGLNEICIFLCKNLSEKIIELNEYGKNCPDAYYAILKLLNLVNPVQYDIEEIKKEIFNMIDTYFNITRLLHLTLEKNYGTLNVKKVSFSSKQGKALLLSGINCKTLIQILEQTKDTEINVYTNGLEMLMTHAFPKINSYKNLKGHFKTNILSELADFATFPGPILMTKKSMQNIEYLYRGRLFTLDPITPVGVVQILNNDFSGLIETAQKTKGFKKSHTKQSINVGYDDKKILKKINRIYKKLLSGEIKQLYFIGLNNYFSPCQEYFEEIFDYIPENSFVFSFSYEKNGKNIYYINSLYDYTLLYKIIKRLKNLHHKSLHDLNINIFVTQGDNQTISNIIYLKRAGIKNIFIPNFSQNTMSENVKNVLKNIFNIKEITTPQKDIEYTLEN
ncbi:MAG: hypothetical protein MJ229_03700 [bacterium]|nr:hypothetical protein [bacterium]